MDKTKKKKALKIIFFFASSLSLLALVFLFTQINNNKLFDSKKEIKNELKTEPNQIIIPKIKLQEKIYDEEVPGVVSENFLNKGVAYYDEKTNQPGRGNCVILGHSAETKEHKAPFAKVNEKYLTKGDKIILTDKDNKRYIYKINEIKVIASTDFSVVQSTQEPTVTLITCIAPDYPRDKRLIVRGVFK